MNHKTFVILLCLLVLAGCSSSYKLQYQGEAGETRQYQMSMNLEQNMQMMGNEMKIAMDVVQLLTQKIIAVDDDGALDISIVYDSLKFDASGPQVAALKDRLAEQVDKITGMELNFKMSPRGKLLEVTTIDSLIPEQLQQLLDPKRLVNSISPNLPEHPVKIGDTWTEIDTTPVKVQNSEMMVTSNTSYKLVGKEKLNGLELLKITQNGEVEIEGEMEQMGMTLYLEGDGEFKGEFLFDSKRGSFHQGNSETEMDMTIAMTGQQNRTIPMTQFVRIKVSKLK
ncbi:MAG: DUF6263 family protein [bacterium]|nr:DUF6263 family protein [bacterium]